MYKAIRTNLKEEVKDIIFATMHYDKNDMDFEIKSFPKIMIYKKNDKENPIEYDMIREYDVLLEFLGKKVNWNLFDKPKPEFDFVEKDKKVETDELWFC